MSNQKGISNNELNACRVKTFETEVMPMIKGLSAEEIRAKWMRGDGLNKAKLAKAVGWGCKTQTFRQGGRLEVLFKDLEKGLQDAKKLMPNGGKQPKTTTQQTGMENEEALKTFIENKLQAKTPWPMDHNGTLYRKAVFAEMSGQQIDEVTRPPTWFSSRSDCKEALDDIDAKVIRDELPTVDMGAYSAMDQVTDDMTNPLIRKLQSEIKNLQQTLEAERREKLDWKRKYDQLGHREKHLMYGSKIPRLIEKES